MKAMFKVTLRQPDSSGLAFTSENVLASSAAEAIKKVEADAKRTYKGESLIATDVEMIGVVTVG